MVNTATWDNRGGTKKQHMNTARMKKGSGRESKSHEATKGHLIKKKAKGWGRLIVSPWWRCSQSQVNWCAVPKWLSVPSGFPPHYLNPQRSIDQSVWSFYCQAPPDNRQQTSILCFSILINALETHVCIINEGIIGFYCKWTHISVCVCVSA